MAQTYAISEGLVVLAACYSAWRFNNRRQIVCALACGLFALAAAIGTIRFGFGQEVQLQTLHSVVSQIGGLLAVALLFTQTTPKSIAPANVRDIIGIAISALVINNFYPAFGKYLFIGLLVLGFIILIFGAIKNKANFIGAFSFAIMIPNTLFVRGSPLLGQDLAFQSFHVIIAIWLALLPLAIQPYKSFETATSAT